MNENVKEALKFVLRSKNYPRYGYMTLSRCHSDCDYYLGNGRIYGSHLYMGNPQDQIEFMKALWQALEEKPEWLTFDQILEYERRMLTDSENGDDSK